MTKTDKSLLGRHNWYLQLPSDGFLLSHSGVDAVWYDPDATLEQLKAATDPAVLAEGLCYRLEQYQLAEQGRRTYAKPVEIKRYELDGGGK